VRWHSCLLAASVVLCVPATAQAGAAGAQTVSGPVEARVVKVHDGDSFSVQAQVWPGTVVSVSIRVRGVDAPELRSRCPFERRLARRSRAELAGLLANGGIRLTNIGGDKYYGRVLADITLDDGSDLAQVLLDTGFVRPYAGKARKRWCGLLQR
jgi:endonuclease YncB( thermonuclease family)